MHRKFALVTIGLVLGAVAMTVRLSAHHAFAAEFDADKPMNVHGTVTRVEWINPHIWLHIDIKQSDGTVEEWMIEGGSPNGVLRRGFTKASLTPGTEIVVSGYMAKDGSHKANGRDLTLPNGKTLFMGSTGTGAPDDSKEPK